MSVSIYKENTNIRDEMRIAHFNYGIFIYNFISPPEAGGLSSRLACAIHRDSQNSGSTVLCEYYKSSELLNSVDSVYINPYIELICLIEGNGNQMAIMGQK